VLHYRGYDLHQRDPADLGTPAAGMVPANPPLTGNGKDRRQYTRTCSISVSWPRHPHPSGMATITGAMSRIR
jgi:hypothetical protein